MKKVFILLLSLLICAGAVNARTLKIGMSSDARSMDPYFHNETATNSMLSNIFEGLTYFDKDLNVYPVLAESWKVVGENTWEFKLRKGVKFHNGNDFNVDDVIFSIVTGNDTTTSDSNPNLGRKLRFKSVICTIEELLAAAQEPTIE